MNENLEKIFKLMNSKLFQALRPVGFVESNSYSVKGQSAVVFTGDNIAYTIIYDDKKKLFNLCSCSVIENNKIDQQWKTISSWLFDEHEHSNKDAISIAEDFIETIVGKNALAVSKKTKKKKSDNNTVDPLFLMNRLVNIWPDLKADINHEKENYECFRSVTFVKDKVLPRFSKVFMANNPDKLKKMANILSDIYKVGDLDSRGIITIVILNSVSDAEYIDKIEQLLSDELKKAWKFARKIKGKKIKAEKPKKQKKNIWAQTLKESAEIRR